MSFLVLEMTLIKFGFIFFLYCATYFHSFPNTPRGRFTDVRRHSLTPRQLRHTPAGLLPAGVLLGTSASFLVLCCGRSRCGPQSCNPPLAIFATVPLTPLNDDSVFTNRSAEFFETLRRNHCSFQYEEKSYLGKHEKII